MHTEKNKIAVILLTLMSNCAILVAQPRLATPEMYVGAHAGLIGSTMRWQPSVEGTTSLTDASLLGANGGLVFRYSAQKCCAVQVELNYMQRGWREKITLDALTTAHYCRRLDYLELPLLMHIYFGSNQWRGIVNLGPQIGYCVSDHSSGPQHPTETNQYAKIDHPFDWGLAAGIGVYYRSQRAGVYQLETRFNYSLGDCFSNTKTDYFAQSHAMNLSINLAYLWEIKK